MIYCQLFKLFIVITLLVCCLSRTSKIWKRKIGKSSINESLIIGQHEHGTVNKYGERFK